MNTSIWCPTCDGERPAVKMYGPLPGAGRRRHLTVGWWNVCRRCNGHFATFPPQAVRARIRRRGLARAGQLDLFGKEAA